VSGAPRVRVVGFALMGGVNVQRRGPKKQKKRKQQDLVGQRGADRELSDQPAARRELGDQPAAGREADAPTEM
jgi:hypothetical protein